MLVHALKPTDPGASKTLKATLTQPQQQPSGLDIKEKHAQLIKSAFMCGWPSLTRLHSTSCTEKTKKYQIFI